MYWEPTICQAYSNKNMFPKKQLPGLWDRQTEIHARKEKNMKFWLGGHQSKSPLHPEVTSELTSNEKVGDTGQMRARVEIEWTPGRRTACAKPDDRTGGGLEEQQPSAEVQSEKKNMCHEDRQVDRPDHPMPGLSLITIQRTSEER